jgi:hexosaminidase
VRHRANSEEMISRLAGSGPLEPLRTLADAAEALGLGPRIAGRNNTLSPLNRFVDAISAESESVRALELAARRLISDPSDSADAAYLRARFATWSANDAQFQTTAAGNEFLTELKPFSQDLAALGADGNRLLDILGGAAADAHWLNEANAELTRLLAPRGYPALEVKMAAARPVKLLLDAVSKRAN